MCVGLPWVRFSHARAHAVKVLLELCKLASLVELIVSLGVVLHRFHIICHLFAQNLLLALLKRHFLLLFDLPGDCLIVVYPAHVRLPQRFWVCAAADILHLGQLGGHRQMLGSVVTVRVEGRLVELVCMKVLL